MAVVGGQSSEVQWREEGKEEVREEGREWVREGGREIKWGTMIPLVGGSALGCARAAGSAPQYHLSYSPFANNESHLVGHWGGLGAPWHILDREGVPEYPDLLQAEMDFINSVCPCAGLSMLNRTRDGEAGRGADAVQNAWMLKSAQYVLARVRPKVCLLLELPFPLILSFSLRPHLTSSSQVLWGENAPALYQGAKELVEKLVGIGREHGYSFSMVKTDSQLHGLPQRRVRTFYFFWLSPTVPLLDYKLREAPSLVSYLADIPAWATLQDVFVHEGVASERYLPYQFLLQREGTTHAEFAAKYPRGTVAKYLEKHNLIQECIEWLEEHHPNSTFTLQVEGKVSKNRTHIDVLRHMQRKLSVGLGYWDDSIKFMGKYFSAVISKNIAFAIHPTEDRFFNIRELLHLMGMPHDFQLKDARRNINHLCQNVPVNTAADWAAEVVRFCRGEAKMTEYTFLRQDNINQTITDSLPPQEAPVKVERGVKVERVARTVKSERMARREAEARVESRKRASPVPFASSSKHELRHELWQMEHKKAKALEGFQPTRSEVERLLGEYSRARPDSPPVDRLQELAIAGEEGDTFRCGLCGAERSSKEQLNLHWSKDCNEVVSLQCDGCGFRGLSQPIMNQHWAEDCEWYSVVKNEVKQEVKVEMEEVEVEDLPSPMFGISIKREGFGRRRA